MRNKTKGILASIFVVSVLVLAGSATAADGMESPNEESDYTFYWFIGEDAANTTVHIYAKQDTIVTFSGTNDEDVEVDIDARQFASFNALELGYGTESKWFYLEMNSNHPIMTILDKEILIKWAEDDHGVFHGDGTAARPAMKLETEYYIANGDSGSEDDILVVYAPEETTLTAKRVTNDGEVFEKTVTVNGMFVTPYISLWLGRSYPVYEGYSLVIRSDKPIAASLFEELPWWPNPYMGSGKYLGNFGTSVFYNDYINFEYISWGWGNIYTPDAAELTYLNRTGDVITTMDFERESSASTPVTRYSSLGYKTWKQPYLIRVQSEEDFVHGEYTPVETEVEKSAAYMGYNSSNSFLELYSFEDAEITVYDGREGRSVSLSIKKETLNTYILVDDLGFEAYEPFLMSIVSSEPVYQQIRIPIKPFLIPSESMYLRHYPITLGPALEIDFTFDPQTLNLDSKGRWVTAYLKFPAGYSPSDVDISTVLLQNSLKVEKYSIVDNTLVLKFNRKKLQEILEPGEEVLIEITGNFKDGMPFYGTTTIRVIQN
ncbi:MAG: hypothetical protein JSV43_04865 [Methanobacteriota archaeon]|nr:MAG: hypothetical protein JSV43_04865 [Euryarchaeota archaeon]